MSTDPRERAWVEIREGALLRNLARIREAVPAGTGILPMVKADAYGLGAERVVAALEPTDPWGFGVATLEEARQLRDLGVRRRICVYTPLPPGGEEECVRMSLLPSVSDLAALDRLAEAARTLGRPAGFQLEIDTGMGRAGFPAEEAAEWGTEVARRYTAGGLHLVGLFTHYHSADEADRASARQQWERFQVAVAALETILPEPPEVVHAANSAAALASPDLVGDLVRPGIHLYGGFTGENLPAPDPVIAVRARVGLVREVPAGTSLGYEATYRSTGPERWATLTIGYGDGLPRALSNRGSALLHGRRVPIVGRISMDMTVVDTTGVEGVAPGDVATLIGEDPPERVTLQEVAETAGTIDYEILTGLGARLPRVWIGAETV